MLEVLGFGSEDGSELGLELGFDDEELGLDEELGFELLEGESLEPVSGPTR